jgi:hypothetical protein
MISDPREVGFFCAPTRDREPWKRRWLQMWIAVSKFVRIELFEESVTMKFVISMLTFVFANTISPNETAGQKNEAILEWSVCLTHLCPRVEHFEGSIAPSCKLQIISSIGSIEIRYELGGTL